MINLWQLYQMMTIWRKGVNTGGIRKNPIVKPETIEYDNTFESSIRPKDFDSYIGQGALKETLKITLEAAKKRSKPLDICYFSGPSRAWENQQLPESLPLRWELT